MNRLRVVTLNIHKGLSQFNRRMVLHELREGLRALAPDVVFLRVSLVVRGFGGAPRSRSAFARPPFGFAAA